MKNTPRQNLGVESNEVKVDAATKSRLIKTITVNKAIFPSTDEDKLRRNVLDKNGNPKVSRRPLSSGIRHMIRSLEIYNYEHDCDLCGGSNKSITIVVIEDTSTGEMFRVAGDCLDFHFAEDIGNLEAGSQGLRLLLNMLSEHLGHYFEDTTSAIAYTIEHFDELVSFPCKAVAEAKKVLSNAKNNPQAAVEGAFDKDLTAIRLLIEFQSEARTQPERFKARWEAAKAHPRLSEVGIHLGSLETVEYRLAELNLKQVVELRDLLDILRVSPPQLMNPVIPWHSLEKTPYRQSVEAYYLEETNLLPSLDAEFYDVQNDHFPG